MKKNDKESLDNYINNINNAMNQINNTKKKKKKKKKKPQTQNIEQNHNETVNTLDNIDNNLKNLTETIEHAVNNDLIDDTPGSEEEKIDFVNTELTADDAFSGKEEVVLEEPTVEEAPDLTADNAFAEGLEVPKEEPSQTVEEPIVEEEPDLTADDAFSKTVVINKLIEKEQDRKLNLTADDAFVDGYEVQKKETPVVNKETTNNNKTNKSLFTIFIIFFMMVFGCFCFMLGVKYSEIYGPKIQKNYNTNETEEKPQEEKPTTGKKVSYVGVFKADGKDELVLREDGTFKYKTDDECSSYYVGKYTINDESIFLESTVFYSCNSCYSKAENKQQVFDFIKVDNKTLKLGKTLYTMTSEEEEKEDQTKYITNPVHGLIPQYWGEEWSDCDKKSTNSTIETDQK